MRALALRSASSLALLVAAALAPPCSAQPLIPSALPGHWTGTGRLYNTRLRTATGPLPFDLQIAPDLTLSGQVGGARLVPARPVRHGERLDYTVRLEGQVHPHRALRKPYLLLLVTAAGSDRLHADFHLKARPGFDATMRPGSLSAHRTPPPR